MDEVFETAIRLLKASGGIGFSVSAVVKAGGWADGTVHKLVGGTDDIIRELLRREREVFLTHRGYGGEYEAYANRVARYTQALRHAYAADLELSTVLDSLQRQDPNRWKGVRAEIMMGFGKNAAHADLLTEQVRALIPVFATWAVINEPYDSQFSMKVVDTVQQLSKIS